jgi:hypothetical protein
MPVISSAARLKEVIFQSWSTVKIPSAVESRIVAAYFKKRSLELP